MGIACIIKVINDFKIKSKEDAKKFVNECICAGSNLEITDVEDKTKYHSIAKDKAGRLVYGTAHYGKDALLAEPCMMDYQGAKEKAVEAVWRMRKYVNKKYLTDNS